MRLLVLGMCIFIMVSCTKNKANTSDILPKINELPELKKAEARIDSLKNAGLEVEMQISIIKKSFYPEDSLKNIYLLLIEENYGYTQNILYEIKFIKTTGEIISIKP
jgi:hypothetical protein